MIVQINVSGILRSTKRSQLPASAYILEHLPMYVTRAMQAANSRALWAPNSVRLHLAGNKIVASFVIVAFYFNRKFEKPQETSPRHRREVQQLSRHVVPIVQKLLETANAGCTLVALACA